MAYGLSRALQGAAEGVERGTEFLERQKQRERADVQFQQGQEDRDYMLDRRELEDKRADDQYRTQKKMQDRFMAGNDALRNFMTTGDLDTVNEFLNMYSPQGLEHTVKRNEDGTYEATMDYQGKSETKTVSEDDIGTAMQLYMTTDPYAKLEEQIKTEQAAETKKGDRAHDMAKIDKEYGYKMDIERIKQKGDPDGTKGTSLARHKLSVQKELNDLSKEDYGTLFGDQWKFDTTREKSMRAAQADLSNVYYWLMDEPDTNAAHRQSLKEMRQYMTDAQNQADIELDEGQLDKKEYDNRVADIIDLFVDQRIGQLAPKPGQLQRQDETQQGGGQGQAPIPEGAIKLLRENKDNEEYRRAFDEKYGEGAVDRVLNAGDQAAVEEGGVSTDASLIRTAEADEVTGEEEAEAPKTQRKTSSEGQTPQQKRAEMRKSRKDHQKIALSEYKNEWKNMSDKEKVAWFAENSGALKAKSQRSWRKAKAEIRRITSAAHFKKANKEEAKTKKEEFELTRG